MKSEQKTKKELVQELAKLRRKITRLERASLKNSNSKKTLPKSYSILTGFESHQQEIFNSLHEGIALIDKNEITKCCNPAFIKIFDIEKKENIIGKSLMEYIPEDQKELMFSQIEQLKGGIRSQYELVIISAKGNRKDVLISVAPRLDDQNEYIGAIVTIIDTTETRRLREFASRAKRLETAGQIAGQVAHDFNNLIEPILVYPEIIKSQLPENHPSMPLLDDIELAAGQIAEINQQLLTLGRRGQFNQKTFNLNDLVEQVIKQMKLIPDTLNIDMQLSENLMNTTGNASQLIRVIMNVINNARDSMKDNGSLTIKSENFYADEIAGKYQRVPKGEYIKLTISDTGCGIPDSITAKIFDPYFSTKCSDNKRGSGLGLSIVHAVMEDHNGFTDYSTSADNGTSFYLYFPVAREVIKSTSSEKIKDSGESVFVVDNSVR